jgi:6-phosphogluconate dehydrogenase
MLRIASSDARKREAVQRSFGPKVTPSQMDVDKGSEAHTKILQDLNLATYGAFLSSFIQGMHILSKMNSEKGWRFNFRDILQIWRAGCIIRSNFIVDLLDEVYQSIECDTNNLLAHPKIGAEFRKVYPALKSVVLNAVQADLNVPTLGASLEYYKYSGYTDLPTSFEEAQLDYFGEHMFDKKSEGPGRPEKGSYHVEWYPAKGIHEEE